MLALAEHVTGKSGFERIAGREASRRTRKTPWSIRGSSRYGSRPFAVLQPFSSKVNKEWRADDVVAFAAWLASEGIQPVLRWGPGEESRRGAFLPFLRNPLFVFFSFSSSSPRPSDDPASTARLAARAALFVGADTGPTHLAAAAGTPTLALFGPTRPERYGPVGPRAAVLRASPAAYNRPTARWPFEDVRDAVRRLLA